MLDLVETIRQIRGRLPIPPSLVQHLLDLGLDCSTATRETVPLLLRYYGHPWPVVSMEDRVAAHVARERFFAAAKESQFLSMARATTEFHAAGDKIQSKAARDKFFGVAKSTPFLAMISMARAAIEFGPQYVVHVLHPTATQAVLDTDLSFWPSTTPKALTRPLLVRAQPDKGTGCLFADVTSVLYLPSTAAVPLVLYQRSNGEVLADEMPCSWTREDDSRSVDEILGEGSPSEVRSTTILRWLVTFALFLEAESATDGHRMAEVSVSAGSRPDGRPCRPGQGFTIRHVRISAKKVNRPADKGGPRRAVEYAHPDGLLPCEVSVRGFLRRQPCGPGGKDRKIVHIQPFQSVRYVSPEKQVRVH